MYYGFRRQDTQRSSFLWLNELDASVDEILVNVVGKPLANYESGH